MSINSIYLYYFYSIAKLNWCFELDFWLVRLTTDFHKHVELKPQKWTDTIFVWSITSHSPWVRDFESKSTIENWDWPVKNSKPYFDSFTNISTGPQRFFANSKNPQNWPLIDALIWASKLLMFSHNLDLSIFWRFSYDYSSAS